MPTKRKEDRYEVDPVDGLRRELVGSWAQEKHQRLRHYIDISHAARRKFDGNSTFIDLYCGPGRARVKTSGNIISGSAVAAATEAARHSKFGKIYIADLDAKNVEHCEKRLAQDHIQPIFTHVGAAEATAKLIRKQLSPSALHLAFLDPYNIQALPFSVIQTLAELPRMDLLIHVSTMDLQRNVRAFMVNGKLENFAPGWRDYVDPAARNDVALLSVFHHWCNLIRDLGYQDVGELVERVSGVKNQPLYWLVLASKNKLGKEFWAKVSNVSPQQRLL